MQLNANYAIKIEHVELLKRTCAKWNAEKKIGQVKNLIGTFNSHFKFNKLLQRDNEKAHFI